MTFYELIMGAANRVFTKLDWSNLGAGLINDEDTIKRMLMDGYAAVANED